MRTAAAIVIAIILAGCSQPQQPQQPPPRFTLAVGEGGHIYRMNVQTGELRVYAVATKELLQQTDIQRRYGKLEVLELTRLPADGQ